MVRFPPIRTGDGVLLLPAYSDLVQQSHFYASEEGETWSLRGSLPLNLLATNLQPSVASLWDGTLLAVARNGAGGWLWVTRSWDGGWTWERPVDGGFRNPGSPAALVKLGSGHLILVFNDSDGARRPLSIAVSADAGRTWRGARVLVDGAGTYSYPGVVEGVDGMIHVVYSHSRRWIGYVAVNEAWVVGG
jgi:predicted neuraminidase